jgi:osmotically-inducible protein OsmY
MEALAMLTAESLTAYELDADPVLQRVKAALDASPVNGLRELTVRADARCLLISGKVGSFYHKQLAQETVRPYAADRRVVNQVEVMPG